MFKKVICPACQNPIDGEEYVCPYCHHKNEKKRKNHALTMIPFWRQLILFLVGFAFFQVFASVFSVIVFGLAFAEYGEGTFAYYNFVTSAKSSALINFVSYFVVFGVLSAILILDAYKLVRSFKNWRAVIAGVIGLGAILLFNMVYSTVLSLTGLTIADNANENNINDIVALYPILSIIVFGLLGPICEEITYRVGLFSFFSRINKVLAYVLTIIVFAFIHFDFTSTTMINELLNMPLYGFAAFVFCYLYDHYGFAGSVYAHVSNNLLSITTVIINTIGK